MSWRGAVYFTAALDCRWRLDGPGPNASKMIEQHNVNSYPLSRCLTKSPEVVPARLVSWDLPCGSITNSRPCLARCMSMLLLCLFINTPCWAPGTSHTRFPIHFSLLFSGGLKIPDRPLRNLLFGCDSVDLIKWGSMWPFAFPSDVAPDFLSLRSSKFLMACYFGSMLFFDLSTRSHFSTNHLESAS